jgi:hypothetical protein
VLGVLLYVRLWRGLALAAAGPHMQTNASEALYVLANDKPWFPYGPGGRTTQLIRVDLTTGQWIAKRRGPLGR